MRLLIASGALLAVAVWQLTSNPQLTAVNVTVGWSALLAAAFCAGEGAAQLYDRLTTKGDY